MKDIFTRSTEQETISPALDMENMLDSMSDEEIKQLISQGYKFLDRRKRQHEKEIKEQIRKIAIEAGIKVSFSNRSARKVQVPKSG